MFRAEKQETAADGKRLEVFGLMLTEEDLLKLLTIGHVVMPVSEGGRKTIRLEIDEIHVVVGDPDQFILQAAASGSVAADAEIRDERPHKGPTH